MASITSTIVNVNAAVTSAPQPSRYQQSGALVSVGGTTLTGDTYQYCGSLADVVALLSTAGNYLEVEDMATTFFAQGNGVGVYVLELGVQTTPSNGVTALSSWTTANPGNFYGYLVPEDWDTAGSALNTLAANYSSPSGKTYFFVTTTQATIAQYAATTKAIFAVVPSPSAAAGEFQAAAMFYNWLANNPSAASPAAPMAFRYLYGVTPWPLLNNSTAIDDILSAYGNIVLTGAEGGISTACLFKGTTMDGTQAMWWYAVDWLQINAKQLLAAAIINASNSGTPIPYKQTGINTLLAVINDIETAGLADDLLLSANFTATPFATYVQQNPSDYQAGKYNGFSGTATAQNGFLSVTFNIDATQFAA